MEIIEEEIIALSILLLKKYKIEKKLRQTFKCFIRKLFSCCGLKNIENELIHLNHEIENIKKTRNAKLDNLLNNKVTYI
tara:strand:- start:740 stop:976 length:237 start_codon:yes stop_codon:yes gene_type:complete